MLLLGHTTRRSIDRRLQRDRLDTFLVRLHRCGARGAWERGTWLVGVLWGMGLPVRPPHAMGFATVLGLHALPGLIVAACLALFLEGTGTVSLAVVVAASLWCGWATACRCRDLARSMRYPGWERESV